MFGTLHTSNEGEEPAFITHHIGRRAEDGSVRIHKYAACDACRAKKVDRAIVLRDICCPDPYNFARS
jgi:hypothetical protein